MCVGGRVKLANDVTYKRYVYCRGGGGNGEGREEDKADVGYTG